MTHTMGTWRVIPHENKLAFEGNLVVTPSDMNEAVCTIWTCDDDSETLANANLIAAAPDLLEALCLFINAEAGNGWSELKKDCIERIAYEAALSAIKKAKGQ